MHAYIASDDANPDFVGQRSPDAALSVMFYSRPVQDNFRTEQEGRPIFNDMDFVKIFLPGDDKNIIDTYARDDHKARFPLQWQHYRNKMAGDQQLIGKTPLTEWSRLSQSQVQELRGMKFFAVEDIASASDQAIQRIGMTGGMGAHAFREAARAFLKRAAGDAQDSKLLHELETQKAVNDTMAAQLAQLQAQFAALAAKTNEEPKPDNLTGTLKLKK